MTLTEFERLRREETAFLLYFYGEHCGVCRELYPKIQALLETQFPRVRLIRVDAPSHRELAGQLRMLSIPGLVLFLGGQEVLRANGLISLDLLQNQIRRPYRLLFAPEE
jgi:thioredoxin-like negative regulator of GroEL